jgi:hypothetical protein
MKLSVLETTFVEQPEQKLVDFSICLSNAKTFMLTMLNNVSICSFVSLCCNKSVVLEAVSVNSVLITLQPDCVINSNNKVYCGFDTDLP